MDKVQKNKIRKQMKKYKADIKRIHYYLHRLDIGQDIIVKGRVVRNKNYRGEE